MFELPIRGSLLKLSRFKFKFSLGGLCSRRLPPLWFALDAAGLCSVKGKRTAIGLQLLNSSSFVMFSVLPKAEVLMSELMLRSFCLFKVRSRKSPRILSNF